MTEARTDLANANQERIDAGRPLHVLMIDDSEGDREMARHDFSRSSLPVTLSTATDGIEGLAMLRREGAYYGFERPDVILLDLHMPRLDGKGVLAAVKADPALRDLPVFVLTTSREHADIMDIFGLQASGYFLKPVVLDEVYQKFFKLALRVGAEGLTHAT